MNTSMATHGYDTSAAAPQDGMEALLNSQRLSSALLEQPSQDRPELHSNDLGGSRKSDHGFGASLSGAAGRSHWNAPVDAADHAYFPRGEGGMNFTRRPVRASEEIRRPARGDASWKDPPAKPLAGRGPGRAWRPSAADEADRWKPVGSEPPTGWKQDAKADSAFGHGIEPVHNNSVHTGRQGFANGRGGKPLPTRHTNGAPGSGGPAHGTHRTYNKQDLFAVRSDMLTKGGSQLPLPSNASKEARETPEIWRPTTLGGAAGRSSTNGVTAPAPVPPPPGLVSPYERRLERIAKLAADTGLEEPFTKLSRSEFFYFDHSGHLQGPFPGEHIKAWGDNGQLPDDLLCSTNANGSLAFQFKHLHAVHRVVDAEQITAEETRDLAKREAEAPPKPDPVVAPPTHGPSALLAAELDVPPGFGVPVAAPAPQQPSERSALTASHVQDAARWGGGDGVDVGGWVGTIGQPMAGGSASHDGWPSQGANAVAADHDPVNEIIGDLTSASITPAGPVAPPVAAQPYSNKPKDDPWDPVSTTDPTFAFGGAAPWDSRANAPQPPPPATQPAVPEAFAPAAPQPALNPSPTPQPRPQPRAREAPPVQADAQSYLTELGVVLGKQSPAKPAPPDCAYPVWDAPRDDGLPMQSGAAPWASQAVSEPPRGANLMDIQREEMREREAESARNAARAAAEPPARKPMWAPPQLSGAQPSLDAIMDDEENAADLEGGACMDDDERAHHSHHNGTPYGPPAGWHGATQPRAAPEPEGLFDYDTQSRTAAVRAAPHVQQPPPPPARAGGGAAAWSQHAGSMPPTGAARRPMPAASGVALPQQRQPPPALPAAHAAAPKAAEPEEDEHPLLKKSPKFRAWCTEQMRTREGSLALVSQLLSLNSPGEMNELAQICLKGEGVGSFVTQFWKMKVEAESAAAKGPSAGKKKKKQSLAPSDAQRVAGAAAARAASAAARPAAAAAADDEVGWQSAGAGVKAKAGKGGAGKRSGGGGASKSSAQMGGAFAVLPSF